MLLKVREERLDILYLELEDDRVLAAVDWFNPHLRRIADADQDARGSFEVAVVVLAFEEPAWCEPEDILVPGDQRREVAREDHGFPGTDLHGCRGS